MANPRGAKAREPYKNFDGESQLSESITSFHIGKAWLGEYFKTVREFEGKKALVPYEVIEKKQLGRYDN